MLDASKKEFILDFHETADEFLMQMIEFFPQNKKLKTYQRKYQLSRDTNKFQAIQLFNQYISQYKKAISEKNMDVFLNIPIDEDSEEDNILDALQLKKMWIKLSSSDKKEYEEVLFRYLRTLLYLCEKSFE